MGTTAEKGARVLQSIAEVQEGINNLGGSLTDQTPFKDFKAQLDNIYDVLPKTAFQTGTDTTISNGLKAKLDFEKVYQEVEYIESDGNQFIETGKYISTNNVKFETKIKPTNYFSNTEMDLVSNQPNASGRFVVGYFNKKIFMYSKDDDVVEDNVWSQEIDENNDIILSANYDYNNHIKTLIVNGTSETKPMDATISNNLQTLKFGLFTTVSVTFTGKWYYIKLYENNVLTMDLYPCYRKSDNVIGMYDKVNNKFYTNAGTGTFTKGADVGGGFGNIVGIGQSSQDSTQGYNILENKMANTVTSGGVTYTKRPDGSVLVNGTATGTSYCVLSKQQNDLSLPTIKLFTMQNNYYCTPQINLASVIMMYRGMDGTYYTYENVGGKDIGTVYLQVSNGVTINNLVVYPMIVNGSGTEKPYEPYTGGQASPNPSYPQEIKYVRGKNRFNGIYVNALTGGASPYPYTENNDCRSAIIKVEPNTTYTISKSTSNRFRISEYSTQPQVGANATNYIQAGDSETQYTLTTQSTTKYVLIQVTNQNEENVKLQLEEGTTSTPYLPYNTIEEVVRGKNVYKAQAQTNGVSLIAMRCDWELNGDEFSLTATGNDMYLGEIISAGGSYLSNRGFKIYKNGNSKLSFRITNTLFNKNIFTAYDKNNISLGWTGINNDTGTYTFPDNCEYVTFRFGYGLATVGTTYKTKVMMAYGDEIPDYEPYITPTSYQLSLGDKELYDECTIVGSPDNWKYVDNYYKEKFKDTTIERLSTGTAGKYRFKIVGSHSAKSVSPSSAVGDILSNILTKKSADNIYSCQDGIGITTAGSIVIYHDDFSTYTAQELTNYFANRDDYIVYPLATPIETPITDETLISQLNAWYNAHSLNGTTIITSNGNLPMIIKVRGLKGE